MKSKILTSIVLASAVTTGLMGINSRVNAATITETSAFPMNALTQLNPISFTGEPLMPALKQFNASLGNLTAVDITLSSALNITNASFTSSDISTTSVVRSIVGQVALSMPTVSSSPFSTPLNHTDLPISVNPGQTIAYPDLLLTNSYVVPTITDPFNLGLLDPFIGTGTLPATLSASSSTNFGGTSSYSSKALAFAGGKVTIVYTYNPTRPPVTTPEPSAVMGLLAIGGLGLKRFLKSSKS